MNPFVSSGEPTSRPTNMGNILPPSPAYRDIPPFVEQTGPTTPKLTIDPHQPPFVAFMGTAGVRVGKRRITWPWIMAGVLSLVFIGLFYLALTVEEPREAAYSDQPDIFEISPDGDLPGEEQDPGQGQDGGQDGAPGGQDGGQDGNQGGGDQGGDGNQGGGDGNQGGGDGNQGGGGQDGNQGGGDGNQGGGDGNQGGGGQDGGGGGGGQGGQGQDGGGNQGGGGQGQDGGGGGGQGGQGQDGGGGGGQGGQGEGGSGGNGRGPGGKWGDGGGPGDSQTAPDAKPPSSPESNTPENEEDGDLDGNQGGNDNDSIGSPGGGDDGDGGGGGGGGQNNPPPPPPNTPPAFVTFEKLNTDWFASAPSMYGASRFLSAAQFTFISLKSSPKEYGCTMSAVKGGGATEWGMAFKDDSAKQLPDTTYPTWLLPNAGALIIHKANAPDAVAIHLQCSRPVSKAAVIAITSGMTISK